MSGYTKPPPAKPKGARGGCGACLIAPLARTTGRFSRPLSVGRRGTDTGLSHETAVQDTIRRTAPPVNSDEGDDQP